MVSPEHVDEQNPEDQQAPDPVEEKQVLPVGEKKRPWMELLLRVIAIVVSLISGIAAVYLLVLRYTPVQQFGWDNPLADRLVYLEPLAYLLVGLVALGCAMLFRSWWAILVVPLALSLGAVLTYYLSNQIVPDLLSYDDVGFGFFFGVIIVMPISAVIGAWIGSAISMSWKKRRKL